jgi:glutamine amidotransferase
VRAAIDRGTPVLGICLGLQWLFEGSDEAPDSPGLGIVPGRCFALRGPVKVPHVGWNTLDRTTHPSALLDGLSDDVFAYFTHGYACPIVTETTATSSHGQTFTSVLERGVLCGAQFHPEKSGGTGLRILANFLRLAREAR